MNYPPQPGQYGGSEGWGQQSGPWGTGPHGPHPQAGGPQGGYPQYPQYPQTGGQYPQYPQTGGQYPQTGGQYPQHPQAGGQQQGGATDFWRYVAPGTGGAGMPPKKPRTGLILSLVFGGVLLVGGGVLLLVLLLMPSDEEIAAGDCVSLASERGGHTSPAECGTAESDYEVVDVREGENPNSCPDFWNNVDDGSTYCLVLDVEVGDCLTSFTSDEERLPLKEDCASSAPVDRISDVTEVSDEALCASSDGYYVFAQPPRTVCFNTPEGV